LESFELRALPAAWTPIPDGTVAIAPDDGGRPEIHLADPVTGREVRKVIGYEGSFRGGIHAELGDVTGDGVDDLVFAPGKGGGPRLKVVDGSTGEVIADFMVYEETFRGGVDIAVGDVNNDGFEDVMTGTGKGGGPRIRVIDGQSIADGGIPEDTLPEDLPDITTGGAGGNFEVLYDFFPFEETFRGGVFVGAGDINGDDFADIIAGTGVGGGARVVVTDGATGEVIQNFFAFDPSLRTGVRVGAGDIDDDGNDDILVGAGPGGSPHVKAISGKDGRELASFFGGSNGARGGVHVSGRDVDGDGDDDVVAETRQGNKQFVRGYDRGGRMVREIVEDVDDRVGG
jgi:uncharacterized protein YodC (DUF2158 family)